MLLELEKGEKVIPELFNKVKGLVKNTADVQNKKPIISLNIRDLDALTSPEEVMAAVATLVQVDTADLKLNITKPNAREQVQAFVTLPKTEGENLLKIGVIKVGWCRVKIRLNTVQQKCFKCFGIGHSQWNCSGPDRKEQGLCIRCGEAGHKMRDCKNTAKCCLCAEAGHNPVDHLPASGRCWMRRRQQT